MSQIRAALSMIVMGFVGPSVLMLLGAVIALALFHCEGSGKDDRTLSTHLGGAFVGDDGEVMGVALEFKPGVVSRALVLQGVDGKQLAKFHIFRDGAFTLEPADKHSSRFVFHRPATGLVRLGVSAGRISRILTTKSDDSVELLHYDIDVGKSRVVRIDSEGSVSWQPGSDRLDDLTLFPGADQWSGAKP